MAVKPFRLSFEYAGKRYDDANRGLKAVADSVALPIVDLGPDVMETFKDILDSVADAMATRHSAGWSPGKVNPKGARTGRLNKRTGRMVKSIYRSVSVVQRNEEVIGTIGGNLSARTHEFGATIRPKRAKMLAIPLPGALSARGAPIRPKPRDWPNLFIIKSKKGNLLLVRKVSGRIVPMYYLTKGPVKIPKRLGMQATLDKAAPVFVDMLFDRLLKKIHAFNPVTGGG